MKDFHVHTNISHDGISSMQEYIDYAPKVGVDEITFTEHFDIYEGVESNLKTLDLAYYYEEYKKIVSESVKVNFGIEVGLQPDEIEKINGALKNYPFDFIIGSSHITCKKDMSKDPTFFDGLTRHEAYLRYFEEVLENIRLYDNFDVYGHLDYVVRYGGYSSKIIDYLEFNDIIDSILELLIKKDKGIEINTSGIKYGLSSVHPNVEILKRYKELGGKIITLGSDAHEIKYLASYFDIAYDLLESIGIENITIYNKRVPIFKKIKELR